MSFYTLSEHGKEIFDWLRGKENTIGNKHNIKVDKEQIIKDLCKAICPIIQPYTCFNLCKNVGNCQELKEKVTKIYDIFCLGDIDMKNLNDDKYVNYDNPFVNKGNNTIASNKVDMQVADLAKLATSTTTQFNGVDAWGPYIGKCPKCNSDNIEANYGLVLTSYPPQYNCRCKDCNHTFFSGQSNNENESDIAKPSFPQGPGWVPYNPQQPNITPINPNPGYGYGNRRGWICPRCGKVNSPDRDFCDCSNTTPYSPSIVWCNTNDSSGDYVNPNISTTINTGGSIEGVVSKQ